MTAQEIQKRNEKAQVLRVIQVGDGAFYVESSEGKICYRVSVTGEGYDCTCGDFARNGRTDPAFKCKHISAVEGCVPSGEFETAQFLERKRPKLDERFIIELEGGNEFVKYAGLLDLGHQKGIMRIEVEIVQLPTKENDHFAVCRATVVSKTGETFIDVGDASFSSCNSKVSKHLLRMASTRAIARALRGYTNVGMACFEELADISDVIGNGSPRNGGQEKPEKVTRPRKPVSRIPREKPAQGSPGSTEQPAQSAGKQESPTGATEQSGGNGGKPQKKDPPPEKSKPVEQKPKSSEAPKTDQTDRSTQPKMSEAQKRAVYNLSRRRGISVEELERMTQEKYKSPLESLTSQEAAEFIRGLQQAA